MNFKLLIQYDGTDFHGWQVQDNDRTIQGELERVVSILAGEKISVTGSGRTDAGVHAEGQVANLHLPDGKFTPDGLRAAINGNLWRDIRIMKCEAADESFHARFGARSKTYIYRLINGQVMSPFWRRFAAFETRPLDVGRMHDATRHFIGEHDWTAFSAARSEAENRVRTITDLTVIARYDQVARASLIEITVKANGFLRYMVRSIAGTLIEVGLGAMDGDTIQNAIVTGDRALAGKTAPAHGLTLYRVEYDQC